MCNLRKLTPLQLIFSLLSGIFKMTIRPVIKRANQWLLAAGTVFLIFSIY
jgi:hypothetical protein